ncbi:hypothetical protein E3H11_44005, partial [Bradyrhizobium brasilense]|nr:hypothetical protein [Bradyrhizobium brasilense]
ADDIERCGATVDEALAKSSIAARDVEKVFLTGGTSFVPAVQRRRIERGARELLQLAQIAIAPHHRELMPAGEARIIVIGDR